MFHALATDLHDEMMYATCGAHNYLARYIQVPIYITVYVHWLPG